MRDKKVPDLLSVIVLNARDLKPKRDGRAMFSVVFGIGSSKANTEATESYDGCPEFNCEHEFSVSDAGATLALKVVERQHDDVLGQVSIPVADVLDSQKGLVLTYPLQPHKKKKHASGKLNLIVWVSKWKIVREEDASSNESTKKSGMFSFSRIKEKFLPHEKQKYEQNLVSLRLDGDIHSKKKAFSSCGDLSTLGSSVVPRSNPPQGRLEAQDVSRRPEVSGISPNAGPACGGTRVVIRGSNLGERKEDIIGLFVCGSNVLSSLEYVSSTRLICTTKAWRACEGNVVVETQKGGKGVSLVQFTFAPLAAAEEGELRARKCDGADDSGISMDGGSLKKMKEQAGDDSPRTSASRSIFNLAAFAKSSDSLEGNAKSETTNVNPRLETERTLIGEKSSPSATAPCSPMVGSLEAGKKHSNPLLSALDRVRNSPKLEPGPRSTLPVTTKPPVVEVQPMFQVKGKKRDSDIISALETKLKESNLEVEGLMEENRRLGEECTRLKEYMEFLVSRAMTLCPQILAV